MNKKSLIVTLLVLFTGTVTTGIIIWLVTFQNQNSPSSLYEEGINLATQKEYERAVIFLEKALDKEPDSKKIIWQLARISSLLKDTTRAQQYAQRSWRMGRKDKECFLLLIENSGLSSMELKVEYGQGLLEEIKNKNVSEELNADLLFSLKKFADAQSIYQSLYKQKPTSQLLVKTAVSSVSLKEYQKAAELLQEGIKAKTINSAGFALLISLDYLINKGKNLESLFEAAENMNLEDPSFLYRKAFLYLLMQKDGEALQVLKKITENNDGTGEFSRKARLLMSYIYFNRNDKQSLRKLSVRNQQSDSPKAEAETLFIELLSSLDTTQKSIDEETGKKLYMARKLMPDSFIIKLVNARMQIIQGNYGEALQFYEDETEPLHKIWDRFIMDNTLALQKSGQFREALNLILAYHAIARQGSLESLITLRNLYITLGDINKASEVQSFLTQQYPKSFRLKIHNGYIAVYKNDFKKAESIFNELVAEAPEGYQEEVLSNLYKMMIRNGKYHEVISQIDSHSKRFPGLLLIKAQALNIIKRYDKAEEVYRQLTKIKPQSVSFKSLYFFILNRKRTAEAKKLFGDAQEKFPEKGWPYLGLAAIAMAEKQYDIVEKMLYQAQKDPAEYYDASLLSTELEYLKGNYRKALDNLGVIEIYSPGSARLHEMKALCELKLGKINDSLRSIKKSIALKPSASKILILAESLFNLRELDEAELQLNKLLSNNLLVERAIRLYTDVKILKRDYAAAHAKIEEVKTKVSKKNFILLKNSLTEAEKGPQAAALELENNFDVKDAIHRWLFLKAHYGGDFVEKARGLNLNSADWATLAFECILREDYTNAAACYAEMDNIKNPVMLNNYAWSLMKTGKLKEARDVALEAHKISPRNHSVTDTLATILITSKKYQECIDLLGPQLSTSNKNPKFILMIAKSYEKLGNKAVAADFYDDLINTMRNKDWDLPGSLQEIQLKIKQLKK